MKIKLRQILPLILSTLLFISCASTQSIPDMSEEKAHTMLQREYNNHNWEFVEKGVNEFRVRYPYSKYTPELQILQANSFFYSKSYPAGIATYEEFIRRNPTHPDVEYAYFQIAKSYDLNSQSAKDRDQGDTEKGVTKYKEFLAKYPKSEKYASYSEQRIQILQRRLADHALFVATFYWNKRLYAAALMRYLYILDNYAQFGDIVKIARKNGSYCYEQLAEILEKHPKSDKYLFFRDDTPAGLRNKAKIMAQNP